MAIDPKLVSIKKAADLPSGIPTANGEFLYFEDETLKKAEMSDMYDRLESAYLGIITPSTTIPSTGSWYGTVLEAETFSNVTPAITVNAADFDVENGTANNEVRIIISEGVASKDVRRVKGDEGFVDLDERIKGWVLSEAFEISSPTFNPSGIISSATIKWPDGNVGSISNVVSGVNGITSIRYNRSQAGYYATMNIVYDNNGNPSQSITITK